MEKKFSELICEFLNRRFGTLLARQYVDMALFKLHISDLNSADADELISFFDFISNKLFAKFPKEVQIRKKSVLYYQVFGSSVDLPFQPISYLHYNFGDHFGDEVMGATQKSAKIGDVLSYNEEYQITFVKDILTNMFTSYDDPSSNLIQNEFQKFVGSSDHKSLDSFKCLMPEEGYALESSFKVFKSMFDYMGSHSNNSFSGMQKSDMKICLSKMEVDSRDQDFYVNYIQKTLSEAKAQDTIARTSKEGQMSYITDITKILSEFIGIQDAESSVEECMTNLGIKDISSESESRRQLFLNYIISNTIISNFSEQKKNLAKSKIQEVLLL